MKFSVGDRCNATLGGVCYIHLTMGAYKSLYFYIVPVFRQARYFYLKQFFSFFFGGFLCGFIRIFGLIPVYFVKVVFDDSIFRLV